MREKWGRNGVDMVCLVGEGEGGSGYVVVLGGEGEMRGKKKGREGAVMCFLLV